MAGSWNHMTDDEGRLLPPGRWQNMIENLGDAYEAAEECFGMIWWLATQLGRARMPGGLSGREAALELIRQAEASHRDGVEIGGTEANW